MRGGVRCPLDASFQRLSCMLPSRRLSLKDRSQPGAKSPAAFARSWVGDLVLSPHPRLALLRFRTVLVDRDCARHVVGLSSLQSLLMSDLDTAWPISS